MTTPHLIKRLRISSPKKLFISCFFTLLFFVSCYLCGKYSLKGLADTSNSASVISLAIAFSFFCSSKKTFWFLAFPFSLLVAFYTPIGFVYGQPDFQSLISLLATDFEESSEFLSQIPTKAFVRSLYVPVFAFIAYTIAKKFNLRPWRNKTFILLTVGTLVVLYEPTHFFQKLFNAVEHSKKSLDELNKYVSHSAWGSSSLTGNANKDFVLIVGESARRDYFHLYGYPVENTPFLDSVPSTIVNGLTAGGNYTIGSLTLMLTSPDTQQWEPRYQYNLMDLANSAGIKTTWISNQGMIGRWDTPVSSIGNRALTVHFPNKQAHDKMNLSDFRLIHLFDSELQKPSTQQRFFVLHTIGSHPDACKKLFDVPNQFKSFEKKHQYIACYLSTIKKADSFIERVYRSLKTHQQATGRDFSVIYFADHGMVHVEKDGVILLNNNRTSKFHYDIPLIKIDSDDYEQIFLKSQKSGLRFTEGIAHWLGIQNEQLRHYDLFDGIHDSEDFGLHKKIQAIDTPPDPAIDISSTLIKSP